MQKRMRLTNTTEWTYLGIGERMKTTILSLSIIIFSTISLMMTNVGRIAVERVLLPHMKIVMTQSSIGLCLMYTSKRV